MTKLAHLLALPFLMLSGACTSVGLLAINAPAGPGRDYTLESAAYGLQPWQYLDIYSPRTAELPSDVIVFLYGGRWSSGARADYRFVGQALARQGFTVVIPDYSQYPAVRFPAFVEDGAAAITWTATNLMPHRLFVAGHSAGAHIGALLAADARYGVRDKITAFAGLAGPYAFTPDEADLMDMFGPPERYREMQAPTFIDGRQPPMLLQYGLADKTVGAFNHERLAAAIRQTGRQVTIKTYPDIGHLGIITAFSWLGRHKEIVTDMVSYFRAQPDNR